MIALNRSMSHKWIIDKNVNSKNILEDFTAIVVSAKSGFNSDELIHKTITQGRDDGGSRITVGVRLLQACFYMFGYSVNLPDGKKTFMPSPMMLNVLDPDISEEDSAANYLVNLFCMQYPHPNNRTPDVFQLYFGRLIVKLLTDQRIDSKLYIDECFWFLPFIDHVDENVYEELIVSILEYRKLSYGAKEQLFHSIDDYNNLFANVAHEINYYFLRLFADFGVFELVPDPKHNDGKLFQFVHSTNNNGKTYRNDAYKTRKKITGYVQLSQYIKNRAKKLIDNFSPFDLPSKIDGVDIFSREDWLTNLYQTEPLQYLTYLGLCRSNESKIAETVNNMIHASKYGSRDGKEFENALKPFIELFKETLNVEILSGAGNTDLLCNMEDLQSDSVYNMNLEAKTRSTALEGVMSNRLDGHMRKNSAKFCIIVAPRFSKGVSSDIAGHQIVALRSEEFGNYCYKECINSKSGTADFTAILEIINNNMGSDITHKVRQLTESRYGIPVVVNINNIHLHGNSTINSGGDMNIGKLISGDAQ